jgi:DNA-directed RNA polymerase sigma subunit (sigma70/sigma32)
MTDTSRYKNASLNIETMELLKKQSKTICEAPLSITKTIEHCAKFYEKHKDFIQKNTKIKSEAKKEIVLDYDGKIFEDHVYAETVPRNDAIHYHRVLAKKKKTLQELGTIFGISRERVRQIQEAEMKKNKLLSQTWSKEKINANSN